MIHVPHTALRLLRVITRLHGSPGLDALATRCGCSRPTVKRFLQAARALGVVYSFRPHIGYQVRSYGAFNIEVLRTLI